MPVSSIPAQAARPGSAPHRHVAVFNVPQAGHVLPTLAVVEQLVRRGHRVSYAVTAQFERHVRAAGATPVLYEAADQGEAPEDLVLGVAQAIGLNLGAVEALGAAFADDRPDVVLYDVYAWAGPLLASRWGVPTIHLSPSHVPYEGVLEEMFGLDDVSRFPGFAGLAAALTAHGCAVGVHELTLAPERVVAFLPRAFQRRPETVRAKECHYVGPALADRSFQGSWRRPETGREVVYVSLGSQFTRRPDFYRSCVEAFRGTDHHVVMTVGQGVDPAELGELPANVEVHVSVPQLDVLAAASVFVTHAGMGSTMEALAHGVPLVAVPQMAEQRVNATQIERLGLGVHLPREEVTGQSLREAVRRVAADADIAAGVAAMRQAIDEAGGAAAAADVVDAVLAGLPAPVGQEAP
ncbi:macrolide family glycosyltransferase [Streptomyces sp. URMC 123]|uniref:macrolide family glycosyltransferase n=1 Tax=Streptomyces sp. URMC 123 TaxID=3423403 RepID=UPI003F19A5FA